MRALRILCLHGFRGSGAGLERQMRPLVAGLTTEVEFLYVDAPPNASGGRSWWNAVESGDADGAGNAKRYEGWRETRAWAVAFFEKSAPIDGVFGFSQGAALAALLVGLRAPDGVPSAERPLHFACAMLVSGFVSRDPAHAALYQSRASFALPSLHILGRTDRIVPPEASLALAAYFEKPIVIEHDGGHSIACSVDVRGAVAAFLTQTSNARTR